MGRGWALAGGLKSNRKVRINDPEHGRVYRSLAAYTATLSADDFTAVVWPHADGSARTVCAHLIKTFVKKLGACQVLIVREHSDQPLASARFWATSDLAANLATVVSWAAQRWTIEQFIADVKEEFGTDHYQIRSAIGIVRFWHLAFLGYLFLDEEWRKRHLAAGEPASTIGQKRCWQQKRHQLLLLDWIGARYVDGHTSEQTDQLLAA